jgi:hypothetical protein
VVVRLSRAAARPHVGTTRSSRTPIAPILASGVKDPTSLDSILERLTTTAKSAS